MGESSTDWYKCDINYREQITLDCPVQKRKQSTMDFHTACEKAKAFTKKPTDAEFLEFYGLYKQSTIGDCNIDKPSAVDLKGKAKYDAWNSHKGISKEAAQQAYIATYQKYAPKYA